MLSKRAKDAIEANEEFTCNGVSRPIKEWAYLLQRTPQALMKRILDVGAEQALTEKNRGVVGARAGSKASPWRRTQYGSAGRT